MLKGNVDGNKSTAASGEKGNPFEPQPTGDEFQPTEFAGTGIGRVSEENDPHGDNWLRSLEVAQAKAKKENKLVFLDFTGSDWCPSCNALHENVLTQKPFLDFAKKHLELVVLDFPRQRELEEAQRAYNRDLSRKYNITGFPTVIVMDADGKVLFRESGFGGNSAAAYVETLKKKLGR